MTEYEEICNGKSVIELQDELQYQYSLGYESTDSFPQYIIELIDKLATATYDIKFKGIDYWSRAGYKIQGLNVYIGDVDHLWNYNSTKEEVDAYYKQHLGSLCIFGSTFDKDDDPLGTNIKRTVKLNIL